MDSRDKIPIQQEKRMLHRGEDLTAPKHVNHGAESGDLIGLSGIESPSVPQSNAITRGSGSYITSVSMKEFLDIQKAQMTSFLQHSKEQAEAQRSALGQLTDHLHGITVNLRNIVGFWFGHPVAHQGAHLCEELDRAHKRVVDVEDQCQQLKMDNQILQKQFQETNTKLAEAFKERNELQKLASIANWTSAAKLSDDIIRSKWKQLDYNIRAMARGVAKCQIRRPTDNANKARFESIVPSWTKLLENDDYKELLIAAYLWKLVYEEIFQNGDKFWGGGFIHGLKGVRADLVDLAPEADRPSRLGPTMQHVAKWSAQGTALLSHFYGRDKKAPKKRAAIILNRLKLFCNIAAENPDTDFLQEMKGILETALDLDEMSMGSMAILSIHWPEPTQSKSLRYDVNLMDALAHTKELSPKTTVDFMISPMLLKMGNANGCNYDSEMILCKASVVCE